MRTLAIFDIDGVLADISHRLHYLREKDYDKFYGVSIAEDQPIASGRELLVKMRGYCTFPPEDLWLLTGRPERTRIMTEMWLRARLNLWPRSEDLLMRPDGDYRPSPELKVMLLKKRQRELKKYDLIYFIDDDPENVKAVEEVFPDITGIVFSTKRFKK